MTSFATTLTQKVDELTEENAALKAKLEELHSLNARLVKVAEVATALLERLSSEVMVLPHEQILDTPPTKGREGGGRGEPRDVVPSPPEAEQSGGGEG